MHMHEEKTGYFRYIKPVRRQNSDWGGLAYPYMHVITEKFKGAHTLFTLNPWREEGNQAGTHKLGALLEYPGEGPPSCPLTLKLAS